MRAAYRDTGLSSEKPLCDRPRTFAINSTAAVRNDGRRFGSDNTTPRPRPHPEIALGIAVCRNDVDTILTLLIQGKASARKIKISEPVRCAGDRTVGHLRCV